MTSKRITKTSAKKAKVNSNNTASNQGRQACCPVHNGEVVGDMGGFRPFDTRRDFGVMAVYGD